MVKYIIWLLEKVEIFCSIKVFTFLFFLVLAFGFSIHFNQKFVRNLGFGSEDFFLLVLLVFEDKGILLLINRIPSHV